MIVIAVCIQVAEAQKKSDREIDGFIGSVSAIDHFKADFYYKDGLGVEREKHYSWHRVYDKDGNNPEKTEYPYQLNCYNYVKVVTAPDSKGNKVKTLFLTDYFTNTYNGKSVYVYDTNERESEYFIYDKTDRIRRRGVRTYNDVGAEKESTFFDGKGHLENTVIYAYKEFDSQGNWTKRIVTNQKHKLGSVSQWIEYQSYTYYQ